MLVKITTRTQNGEVVVSRKLIRGGGGIMVLERYFLRKGEERGVSALRTAYKRGSGAQIWNVPATFEPSIRKFARSGEA
jgi:hypothetical protein